MLSVEAEKGGMFPSIVGANYKNNIEELYFMDEMIKNEETWSNFIHDFIEEDLAPGGAYEGMKVHTRFPPEPNGCLHIGHAKAICIDFGTAEKFGGLCNLRMDDTNPTKEDTEFVENIKRDIRWLGFDWADRFYYASDYFPRMYECAVELIKKGLAYVCELTPEEMRQNRGDLNTPAVSPIPGPSRSRKPGSVCAHEKR